MKKLPIGIEHFKEIRREDFYYVDKTGMIKELLENKAKGSVQRETEELVNGGTVIKKINEALTYRDLYKNIVNLWSVLFTTGYLTKPEIQCGDRGKLL